MSNIRYYNQAAPFFDFMASLEDGNYANHPFARAWTAWAGNNNTTTNNAGTTREAENTATAPGEDTDRTMSADEEEGEAAAEFDPLKADAGAFGHAEIDPAEFNRAEFDATAFNPFEAAGFPFGRRGRGGRGRGGWGGPGFGHGGWGGPRGRHGPGPNRGPGPHHGPPPPGPAGPAPPPPPPGMDAQMSSPPPQDDAPLPPQPPVEFDDERGPSHRRHRHEHGEEHGHARMRGGHGGRGRGGGRGGRRGEGPWGGPFNMNHLSDFFQNQIFGGDGRGNNARGTVDSTGATGPNGDFVPPVDVFDTEASFIVDLSVPGAKKTDIAVAWDAEKSELSVTGVVHRSGDEEFLKTLALDERKVGAFARKVRLGSRANPAHVDADGITAKLEDGVLRVVVPKEEKEYEVVHKVEIN